MSDDESEPDELGADLASDTETVPVFAVRPKRGELELAARGWGWPSAFPTEQALDSFTDALETLERRGALEGAEQGAQVATLAVDAETREVLRLRLEGGEHR